MPGRPGIPSWFRSTEIGFEFDGAVIVCGWFTSLNVIEKFTFTVDTVDPVPAGGAICSERASFRSRWSSVPD